jgi:hypothetical protein
MIGERGGINLYGFVFNNSFAWFDFLGLDPRSLSNRAVEANAKLNASINARKLVRQREEIMGIDEKRIDSYAKGTTFEFELIDDKYIPVCKSGDIKAEKVVTQVKVADEDFETDAIGALSKGIESSFEAIGNLKIADAAKIVGRHTAGLVDNFLNGIPKMSSINSLLDVDVSLQFRCCICDTVNGNKWGDLKEHTIALDQANLLNPDSMKQFGVNFSQLPIDLRERAENTCKEKNEKY